MWSTDSMFCPHCDRAIPEVAKKQAELTKKLLEWDEEYRKLQAMVAELQESTDFSLTILVASIQGDHFHREDCRWAEYIYDSDNLIRFYSHEQAVEAGYKPCKTCRS